MVRPYACSVRRQRYTIAMPLAKLTDIKNRVGEEIGVSDWIMIDQANVFTWPGFDLVPQPDGGLVRGVITRGFFERVRDAVLRARARTVDRD